MLKFILLGSAMMIAGPAIAQDGATTPPIAPLNAAMANATMPMHGGSTPNATAADQSTATISVSKPAPQTASAPAASATPQTQSSAGDQVAAIVDSEFGTYDKDASGSLSKVEFAAWMNALKAKAPATASAPVDPKWNDAAFAQADNDKSTSVTKQELTGFLGGAANAG